MNNCKTVQRYLLMTDEVRSCKDGNVRLKGGTVPSHGYVEFCMNGRWGAICSDGWDINNTMVVCSQLNYYPKGVLLD